MQKKAQKVRLGIFVLAGFAIALSFIFFFVARNFFEKTDSYYVAYNDMSVNGLEVGSPIKYLGITVGSITNISINPADVNQIIVELSLQSGTPVKEDATADIVSIGITGLKTIEIRGGSNEADFLAPREYIQSGTSLVENISGRAEIIAYKAEEVLNNLLVFSHPDNITRIMEAVEKISTLAGNANTSVLHIEEVIKENRTPLKETLLSAQQITSNTESLSQNLEASAATFNDIMQGDTLRDILGNIRDISIVLKEVRIEELIGNLAEATMQTQQFIISLDRDFSKSSQDLEENMMLLKYTLENLEDASRKINTNPSILIRRQKTSNPPDKLLQ